MHVAHPTHHQCRKLKPFCRSINDTILRIVTIVLWLAHCVINLTMAIDLLDVGLKHFSAMKKPKCHLLQSIAASNLIILVKVHCTIRFGGGLWRAGDFQSFCQMLSTNIIGHSWIHQQIGEHLGHTCKGIPYWTQPLKFSSWFVVLGYAFCLGPMAMGNGPLRLIHAVRKIQKLHPNYEFFKVYIHNKRFYCLQLNVSLTKENCFVILLRVGCLGGPRWRLWIALTERNLNSKLAWKYVSSCRSAAAKPTWDFESVHCILKCVDTCWKIGGDWRSQNIFALASVSASNVVMPEGYGDPGWMSCFYRSRMNSNWMNSKLCTICLPSRAQPSHQIEHSISWGSQVLDTATAN